MVVAAPVFVLADNLTSVVDASGIGNNSAGNVDGAEGAARK